MAILQNPLIGRAKQKLAGTVFSTWKGLNVLRSKPLTVENPRTAKQQAQRNALSYVVFIYRFIAGIIAVGFKQQAIGKSEYNAFTSENLLNGFVTPSLTPPYTPTVDWSKLEISKGTLGNVDVAGATADVSDDEIVITWDGVNLPVGVSLTDNIQIVMRNRDTGDLFSDNSNEFQDGSATYTSSDLPFSAGNTIDVYVFVFNGLGQSSDSVYTFATATA